MIKSSEEKMNDGIATHLCKKNIFFGMSAPSSNSVAKLLFEKPDKK